MRKIGQFKWEFEMVDRFGDEHEFFFELTPGYGASILVENIIRGEYAASYISSLDEKCTMVTNWQVRIPTLIVNFENSDKPYIWVKFAGKKFIIIKGQVEVGEFLHACRARDVRLAINQ